MANTPRYKYQVRQAMRKAGISPCKDCPDRYPACAADCKKYKDWKKGLGCIRAKIMSDAKGQRAAETTLIESTLRRKESERRNFYPSTKDRTVRMI